MTSVWSDMKGSTIWESVLSDLISNTLFSVSLSCGVQCLLKAAQVQSSTVLPVTPPVRSRFMEDVILKSHFDAGVSFTCTRLHTLIYTLLSCLHLQENFVVNPLNKKPFRDKCGLTWLAAQPIWSLCRRNITRDRWAILERTFQNRSLNITVI